MRRYMKYSKHYRLAIVCFAVVLATGLWIAATAAALFMLPASASFLGMNRTTVTLTLFFVPVIMCAALLLGINFWFSAEGKRMGWYGISENTE